LARVNEHPNYGTVLEKWKVFAPIYFPPLNNAMRITIPSRFSTVGKMAECREGRECWNYRKRREVRVGRGRENRMDQRRLEGWEGKE
jgi:hypothetical protein